MKTGLAVKIKVSQREDVFMMATNSDEIKFDIHSECGHILPATRVGDLQG